MLWKILPKDFAGEEVHIYDSCGAVCAKVPFETALELVEAHNNAVWQAAAIAAPGRGESGA